MPLNLLQRDVHFQRVQIYAAATFCSATAEAGSGVAPRGASPPEVHDITGLNISDPQLRAAAPRWGASGSEVRTCADLSSTVKRRCCDL